MSVISMACSGGRKSKVHFAPIGAFRPAPGATRRTALAPTRLHLFFNATIEGEAYCQSRIHDGPRPSRRNEPLTAPTASRGGNDC
jgi:hypothetical protein